MIGIHFPYTIYARKVVTINEPVDYMARAVMILMRGKDITWAIGRVGLKVEPVLGPEIARATASAIWDQNKTKHARCNFRAQKSPDVQGPYNDPRN